ncbi:MAG: inositol-3-phosphate synthase [Planctomycetota bacterium]
MRVGVWLIGALGDVATTTVLGAAALARGLAPTTGLVTARPPLADLDLCPLDELVFGGHDVRPGAPLEGARALAAAGVVPAALVEACADALAEYAQRIAPGVAFGAGATVLALEGVPARARREAGPRAALAALRADLAAFAREQELDRLVVVALASTEPRGPALPELETAEGVLGLIEDDDPRLPASVLYALAAFQEGAAYVNFTPSEGASSRGCRELARRLGVPHMGRDGKTGQTLVRTALAPMFLARNLDVLSWAGFNILGNRDGEVLDEPGANAAKMAGKDQVLGAILGERLGTSLTRIDYVPSLGDWKTAWDHVHFQGFLGARMQLELTWRGADSALAAPLVLDLARLLELALRRGRSGVQTGLASFFKAPLEVEEQALFAQLALLEAYAAELKQPLPC